MSRIAERTDRGAALDGSKSAGWSGTVAAAALAALFAGATLPSPLYPLYKSTFGFSGLTLTLIYAVYALGNLASLLLFGRLSDQIGRRPVVLASIGAAIVSAGLYLVASSTGWLFAARLCSGLSTALGGGAATAWLADLGSAGGSVAARNATIANFVGLSVGAILTGALAQFAPLPLRTSYGIYLGALGVIAAAVSSVRAQPSAHRRVSLRPRLAVPRQILPRFFSCAATGFAVFAFFGFYAALIANVLAVRLGISAPVAAGAIVSGLCAVAAATVAISDRVDARQATRWSLALLVPCLALLVAADLARSIPLLCCASLVGGVATALGYRGSLALLTAVIPPDRRSEVISSYMIAMFAGNSVPVIGVGLLSTVVTPTSAHAIFAVVVALIAGAALYVLAHEDPPLRVPLKRFKGAR